MGSATSCIAFVPHELSRIWPSIHILNVIKKIEITKAENAIRFAVVFEIKIEKMRIDAGIPPSAPNFIACPAGDSTFLYHCKIRSAYGSFNFAY